MTRKLAVGCAIVAALVVLLLGCQPGKKAGPPGTAAAGGGGAGGTPPADFKLLNAAEFNVANYRGQVLLLDFWATWCGPCKMEIPHLIELQKRYRDQGLVVVGITLDENPDKDVPKYAAEVGMDYANVRGTDALKAEYGVVGLPTIVIFDRAGNKVFNRAGYIEKDVLEKQLQPLLAPPSS